METEKPIYVVIQFHRFSRSSRCCSIFFFNTCWARLVAAADTNQYEHSLTVISNCRNPSVKSSVEQKHITTVDVREAIK